MSGQVGEEFDNPGLPACDVGCNLFQNSERAFATAVVDRFRHIETLARGIEAGHQIRREKIGNIRNDPVVARLNGLVLPQPVHTPPHHRGLRPNPVNHLSQWAFRAKGLGINETVNGRNQIPELVCVINLVMVEISHCSKPRSKS